MCSRSATRTIAAAVLLGAMLSGCSEYYFDRRDTMPDALQVTAETDDGLVMGLSHRTLPLHGVQFHPESIASEHGHLILKNFLDLAAAWNGAQRRLH